MFTSNETSTIHRGEINDSELRGTGRIELLLTTKGVLNHAYNQAFSRIWRLQDNFVIHLAPDQNAPQISFQINLPQFGDIGVFEDEEFVAIGQARNPSTP